MERSYRHRIARNQWIVLAIVGLGFVVRWIGVPLHLLEHEHSLVTGHGLDFGHGPSSADGMQSTGREGFATGHGHGEHTHSGHAHGRAEQAPSGRGTEHPGNEDREPDHPGHSLEDHIDGLAEATLHRVLVLGALAPVAQVDWSLDGGFIERRPWGGRARGPRPPPPKGCSPSRAPPIVI
ncbi:MAG: hypothetical protein ACYS26_06935 [Planctomycetota bacterium]|jgi:hypothetical protein